MLSFNFWMHILSQIYCFVHRSFSLFFIFSYLLLLFFVIMSYCMSVLPPFVFIYCITLVIHFIILASWFYFILFYFWSPGFPCFPWFSFHLMWEVCFKGLQRNTVCVCVRVGKREGGGQGWQLFRWFYRVKHLVLQFFYDQGCAKSDWLIKPLLWTPVSTLTTSFAAPTHHS